ncbi:MULTISPECIES: HGxxPAAW family protein [unclassified Streptomyces]|uniref:HGxxPAAW family protein n=1 Tax=unclassified Streptomyces TaxID=2593676 RepID=UPI00278BD16A|nr:MULTISPECIES: HGxxPAAW family protein [unclassified Streptomyces]
MADSSHGHTPAAWTGVIIAFIGFCVAGAFMVMGSIAGFWAGMALLAIAAIVGGAMHMAGMGKPRRAELQLKSTGAAQPAGSEA